MIELSIITPCSRPQNLEILKKSIDFNKIKYWYIVYDTSKGRSFVKRYNHDKIIELQVNHKCCGAPQRNLGIDAIKSGFVYMLDDDNIIHENFWKLIETFENDKVYTFDQERCLKDNKTSILPGGNYKKCRIDTAQFVVPRDLIGDQRWNISGCADGIFIEELHRRHPDKFVYIKEIGCWWNKLNPRG
jgi:hypothetical protein